MLWSMKYKQKYFEIFHEKLCIFSGWVPLCSYMSYFRSQDAAEDDCLGGWLAGKQVIDIPHLKLSSCSIGWAWQLNRIDKTHKSLITPLPTSEWVRRIPHNVRRNQVLWVKKQRKAEWESEKASSTKPMILLITIVYE